MSDPVLKESGEGRDLRRRGVRLLKRALPVILGVWLLLLLLAPLFASRERVRGGGTSVGGAPTGFRALYELAGALRYDARRWDASYGALPAPARHALVLIDPAPYFGDEEHEAQMGAQVGRLQAWVEAGGTLLFAPQGAVLVRAFGIDVVPEGEGGDVPPFGYFLGSLEEDVLDPWPASHWKPATGGIRGDGPLADFSGAWTPLPPEAFREVRAYAGGTPDAVEVRLFTRNALRDWQPLLDLDGRPFAIWRERGRGRVIALASALPLTNLALRHGRTGPAAAELFAFASDDGRRTLLFDEFAHGARAGGGALRWVDETALGRVFWTALILLAGFAWWGAVRFGRPREERELPRRAKEEYVVHVADLYARSGRRALAARTLVEGLRTDVGAHRGARAAEAAAELEKLAGEVAARPPGTDAALLATARRAMAAHRRGEED